jgi:hypothetical protein
LRRPSADSGGVVKRVNRKFTGRLGKNCSNLNSKGGLDLEICTCSTKLCLPNRCGDCKQIQTLWLANVSRLDIIPPLIYFTPPRAEMQAMLGKAYSSLLNLSIRVVAGKWVMELLLMYGKTTG